MQTLSSPYVLAPDSVQQMREALSRGAALHLGRNLGDDLGATPAPDWQRVVLPKTDAAAWEDTELDLRRVVL